MEYGIVRCVASGTALSVTRAQGSWVQLASGNWTFGPYTLPTTGDQGGIGGRLLCPGLNGLPILDLGSRGASVVAVQKSLQQLGYNTGNTGADGVYGPLTKAAVQRFQKDYGLLADGRVGPATWNALGKAIGGSLPMPPINGGTVTPPPINGGGEVATGDRVTLNAVDANAEVIASATVRNGPAPDSEVTGEVLTPGMTVTILETLNGSYRLKGNSELLWVPMTTLQRF
ncbi:MAG: peptidoglycan-binding protein [Spirulinaceae cyanobacterium RM2_2_10]|nr:peptidoglycan-binding protein [Spirulinaceae cyanobacterium SM2_1_0]NJO21415.1 peptidoglycan-binding protein [Spirulinaceae cyanobacterium RM2_2_10]